MVEMIPTVEDLLDAEKGRLIGGRCKKCGKISFPIKSVCHVCWSEDLEKIELSKDGKIYTFTICTVAPEHFEAPYAVGYIDLPEGVRIFSLLTNWKDSGLRIGMDVEMVIEAFSKDESGEKKLCFKFKPKVGS